MSFCQFGRSRPAWRLLFSGPGRAAWLASALDQALSTPRTDDRVWVPAIDVIEQKDSYLMYAELPGVDPSQIDITFEQNVLTVRGTKPSTVQASNDGELRVFASFERFRPRAPASFCSLASRVSSRLRPPGPLPVATPGPSPA